jgi:hypothetical protein
MQVHSDRSATQIVNAEKFEGEGWRTLWLAIAGVLAITLTWNVLMLSLNGISYWVATSGVNMKIERFAGHHEAREALVLSVAAVTAIMLIESLILMILYWATCSNSKAVGAPTPDGFALSPIRAVFSASCGLSNGRWSDAGFTFVPRAEGTIQFDQGSIALSVTGQDGGTSAAHGQGQGEYAFVDWGKMCEHITG